MEYTLRDRRRGMAVLDPPPDFLLPISYAPVLSTGNTDTDTDKELSRMLKDPPPLSHYQRKGTSQLKSMPSKGALPPIPVSATDTEAGTPSKSSPTKARRPPSPFPRTGLRRSRSTSASTGERYPLEIKSQAPSPPRLEIPSADGRSDNGNTARSKERLPSVGSISIYSQTSYYPHLPPKSPTMQYGHSKSSSNPTPSSLYLSPQPQIQERVGRPPRSPLRPISAFSSPTTASTPIPLSPSLPPSAIPSTSSGDGSLSTAISPNGRMTFEYPDVHVREQEEEEEEEDLRKYLESVGLSVGREEEEEADIFLEEREKEKKDKYKSAASFSSFYAAYASSPFSFGSGEEREREVGGGGNIPPVPAIPASLLAPHSDVRTSSPESGSSSGTMPTLARKRSRRSGSVSGRARKDSISSSSNSNGVQGLGPTSAKVMVTTPGSGVSTAPPTPTSAHYPSSMFTTSTTTATLQSTETDQPTPFASSVPTPKPKPRYQHALLELLTSEQSYTSDLALLRDVYIPLACGEDVGIKKESVERERERTISVRNSASSGVSSTSVSGFGFGSGSSGDSTRTTSTSSSILAGNVLGPMAVPPASGNGSGSKSPSASKTRFGMNGNGAVVSTIQNISRRPPMSPADVQIIFSNVGELGALSEIFARRVEACLVRMGVVGSEREEGRLFGDGEHEEETLGMALLDMIPKLEKPYTSYIAHHPRALERYTLLSTPTPSTSVTGSSPAHSHTASQTSISKQDKEKDKTSVITPTTSLNPYLREQRKLNQPSGHPTPEFVTYLERTRIVASPLTNAWDIPSLLIKPVQRLLKYGLLIGAVVDAFSKMSEEYERPKGFDREELARLAKAKTLVDEVARRVNEHRRRLEVVRAILDGKGGSIVNAIGGGSVVEGAVANGGHGSNATDVSSRKKDPSALIRLKAFKLPPSTVGDRDASGRQREKEQTPEMAYLALLTGRAHAAQTFVTSLQQGILSLLQRTRMLHSALHTWSIAFGRVIGLGESHGSEAMSAFEEISSVVLPELASSKLEYRAKILLVEVIRLGKTLAGPLLLLKTANTLAPAHQSLVNEPYNAKHRPSPSLVAASQSYTALSAQLRIELPRYLSLLERGLGAVVVEWADVQGEFWKATRHVWGELWVALGMEGEAPESPGDGGGEVIMGPASSAAETIKVWWERFEDVEKFMSDRHIIKRQKIRIPPRHSLGNLHYGQPPISPPPPSTYSQPGSTRSRRSNSSSSRYDTMHARSNSGLSTHHSGSIDYTHHDPRTPLPIPKYGHSTIPERTSASVSLLDYTVYQNAMGLEQGDVSGGIDEFGRPSIGIAYEPSTSPPRRVSSPSVSSRRRTSSHSHDHVQPPPYERHDLINSRSPISAYHPPQASSPPVPRRPSPVPIYTCTTIHRFQPPASNPRPASLPFLNLHEGELVDILEEMGTPSTLEGFSSIIEDGGQDCLLLGRDRHGLIGWVLASFLMPMTS